MFTKEETVSLTNLGAGPNVVLGNNLTAILTELGLSQVDFAKPLTISSGYISDLERGKSMPSEAVFRQLEAVYRINRNWILTNQGQMFNDDIPFIESDKGTAEWKGLWGKSRLHEVDGGYSDVTTFEKSKKTMLDSDYHKALEDILKSGDPGLTETIKGVIRECWKKLSEHKEMTDQLRNIENKLMEVQEELEREKKSSGSSAVKDRAV